MLSNHSDVGLSPFGTSNSCLLPFIILRKQSPYMRIVRFYIPARWAECPTERLPESVGPLRGIRQGTKSG